MFTNLNPGAVGIQGLPLAALVSLATRHGFGGVDLPVKELTRDFDAEQARTLAAQSGLRWGLFWMPFDLAAPEEKYVTGLQALPAVAALAARAGATRTYNHIWPGHDERDYAANFRFHVERIKPVAAILAEHGISFGIEFIGVKSLRAQHRHEFIYRLDQALELIAAVGNGAGLVLDFFHWHNSGGTVAELRRWLPGVKIVNVHANDARADRSRDEQIDHERALPLSTGVIDAAGIMMALREVGYDGPIIAEPFQPERQRLAVLGPERAAAEVSACLARLLRL
jgi:sugar phosphate isomerase/epimerase